MCPCRGNSPLAVFLQLVNFGSPKQALKRFIACFGVDICTQHFTEDGLWRSCQEAFAVVLILPQHSCQGVGIVVSERLRLTKFSKSLWMRELFHPAHNTRSAIDNKKSSQSSLITSPSLNGPDATTTLREAFKSTVCVALACGAFLDGSVLESCELACVACRGVSPKAA